MKFVVVGTAKYIYELEAEDEDKAIERARELFLGDIPTLYEDILSWSARPLVEERASHDSIVVLDLPSRITNALRRGGIATIGELISKRPSDLLGIRQIGWKAVADIEASLLVRVVLPESIADDGSIAMEDE